MNRVALLALACALILSIRAAEATAQQPAPKPAAGSAPVALINIPFERYTLPNGLTVVLSEDHATPTVAVEVAYHVGSKNEVVPRTGFAHLFEHVMFTGSGHVPYGVHDRYTEGVGGGNNGQTWYDWTRYFETVPSNYLETILWLESDRMGFLLDSLSQDKFVAQREIVQNERRQSYDNQPYGRNGEVIGLAMYPKSNPYSWPTIGSMADLRAATVDDVRAFFKKFYAPNNATLAIVGDFDPAAVKPLIAKYFGDLSRGPAIVRPVIGAPSVTGEKRITLEDRVQVPRLTVVWPSVAVRSTDQPALDLLSDILGNSRTARITKSLVYDRELAASAQVYQDPMEGTGQFSMILTPRPGHTLTELETAADSIITQIKRDGPTAEELTRVKAGQQANFIDGLQSNLGKAFQLAEGQMLLNDPSHAFKVSYPRTQAVTAADIKRVANQYLTAKRVVLSTVPLGQTQAASHAAKSTVVTDPFTETAPGARP